MVYNIIALIYIFSQNVFPVFVSFMNYQNLDLLKYQWNKFCNLFTPYKTTTVPT